MLLISSYAIISVADFTCAMIALKEGTFARFVISACFVIVGFIALRRALRDRALACMFIVHIAVFMLSLFRTMLNKREERRDHFLSRHGLS